MVPRLKQFTVVGIFDSGHYEYDSGLALMHIEDAAALFRARRARPACGCKLERPAPGAARWPRELRAALAGDVAGARLDAQNRNWFAAVQIEKRMMFIILTLIVAVAAFNLVSTLVMTVTDKQADIAILRTLGATPALDHGDLHGAGRAGRRASARCVGVLLGAAASRSTST